MDKIQNGWFSEVNEQWPGQALSLEVEEVLYQGKSKFQDVLIFKSKTYGNVLVLDGVVQCTDRDEFSYQEMISFLPLNSHPNPKKVLVIGGGDGGVIREVVKLSCVESVVQCEIDQDVIELSKKFLPNMAKGYSSSKLTQHIGDGFEYMKNHENEFDVIITDSSDPVDEITSVFRKAVVGDHSTCRCGPFYFEPACVNVMVDNLLLDKAVEKGPAESLFQKPYYELMSKALKPDGVLCCQGECMWIHLPLIRSMLDFCDTIFPVCSYGYTTIPTYPSGQIGFILCSNNKDTKFSEPVRVFTDEELDQLNLRYYNSDVHRAAFILPQFVRKALFTDKGD